MTVSEARQRQPEQQDFGHDPIEVRDTEHYKQEYIEDFVDRWDQLIDWNARAESEGAFFIEMLRQRGAKKVLDVATGTGFHSVRLMDAGFDVTSADGSPQMLARAFANGRRHDKILRTVQADWRWLNRDLHGRFDAIICLGNSFTHLFDERDRRKALAEFYSALKHDGVLILDQRNYDAILDHGVEPSHTYYYCGDKVSVDVEHVDDGLARFAYTFPDRSKYHLNMYPLRRNYTRKLMYEVGFQTVETFADFQETHRTDKPDYYVHVASKYYGDEYNPDPSNGQNGGGRMSGATQDAQRVEAIARDYYDSTDADSFYFHVWGGEDIHIGLYDAPDDAIFDASRRTVERLAGKLSLDGDQRVLDLGAGYGGAARWLAREHGCHVECLNLSSVQNERNRLITAEQGLREKIGVTDGSFEDLPYDDASFDALWSQDAILHSGHKKRVFEEAARVMRPGATFVFTDPMQAHDADRSRLKPVLERIHLDHMGSPGVYEEYAADVGLDFVEFEDLTRQLINHYSAVRRELEGRRAELVKHCSDDYLDRMVKGLGHWVAAGTEGLLSWGVFTVKKPA